MLWQVQNAMTSATVGQRAVLSPGPGCGLTDANESAKLCFSKRYSLSIICCSGRLRDAIEKADSGRFLALVLLRASRRASLRVRYKVLS